MRIDWYTSYPHEKVVGIAKQLYRHLPVKSQGATNQTEKQGFSKYVCGLYRRYI
jgi:hypothetical protein